MEEINASDCVCCKCGKPAVCFWPVIDPDIKSWPWCRECKEKESMELLIKIMEEEG